MSHGPPGGPPPPYYSNNPYPAPPAVVPPAYSYYPGSVMVSVYPPLPNPLPETSNNTYVNNTVYQQPEQVQVVDNGLDTKIEWVPATASSVDNFYGRAVVAGYEGWDKSPLWVIRSHLNGACIPGKLAARHKTAYVPHGRKEVRVYDFEILIGSPHLFRWIPSSHGAVPPGAIRAGNTKTGEPLYVARSRYLKSLTPGKVHPSHGCCYISFAGVEVSFKLYEVLCHA